MATARLVIFDLDGVLLDFHPERRLRYLSHLTGRPAAELHQAIWGSEFEPAAEAGAYPTGQAYLEEFNRRIGYPLSREQWIAARRAAMTTRSDVLRYVRRLGERVSGALLTNNGALLKESLPALVPEVVEIFGTRCFVSCEFRARKPEPAVYLRLLERCGVPPEAAVFVDDSPANVEGATLAGLRGVHFEGLTQLELALAPFLSTG